VFTLAAIGVGLITLMVVSALSQPPGAANSVGGTAMLCFMICGYLFAKAASLKRAWAYPFFALLVALATAGTTGAVQAYVRILSARMGTEDLIAAAEQFDPVAGSRLRTLKENPVAYGRAVAEMVNRAVMRASDDAVVEMDRERVEYIAGSTPSSRCIDMFNLQSILPEDCRGVQVSNRAVAALFRSAAKNRENVVVDRERALTVIEKVYGSVSADLLSPEKLDQMPRDEFWRLYVAAHRRADTLRSVDAALMIRFESLQAHSGGNTIQ